MRLRLNGEEHELQNVATLRALLASLQLTEKLILVELNGHAVPRADFPTTKLEEGDAIEIVRMVAGG
jgi:thiamine biosynthesis protein ThiS